MAKQGTDYLALVRRHATVDGVLGLKIHWYQLECGQRAGLYRDIAAVFPPAMRSSLQILFLRRRDRVAQAISTLIAEATYIYYLKPGAEPTVSFGYKHKISSSPEYHFYELQRIIAMIKSHEQRWLEWFAARNLEHCDLYYEDLVADYKDTVRTALRYLGVPDLISVPSPQSVRQATSLNREFHRRYLRDLQRLQAAKHK